MLLVWSFSLEVIYFITGSLVDKKGKILVPGIYNDVAPLTEEEKKLYEKIDFDLEEYCKDVGAGKLLHDTKAKKRPATVFKKVKFVALFCNFCPHRNKS